MRHPATPLVFSLLTGCAVDAEPTFEATTEHEATIVHRVPIRIVEPHACNVDVDAGCAPYATSRLLTEVIDRANAVYAAAGVEVWIKSVEYINAPSFVQFPQSQSDVQVRFDTVESQLRAMFPAMPASAFADGTLKTRNQWINACSALFADPDEALFVLYEAGQSQGQFPEAGRFFRASIGSVDGDQDGDDGTANSGTGHGGIFPHELGHFLGLGHADVGVRGINPSTGSRWTRSDAYDMHRCAGTNRSFYTKLEAGQCNDVRVVEAENGGSVNDIPTLLVEGVTSNATDNRFPGLLFDLGGTHNPPNSFRYGINVMTYYSHYPEAGGDTRIDIRVPGRLSATQAQFVRTYLEHDAPYDADARASHIDGIQTFDVVANNHKGLRPELGQHTDDMLWLANGKRMTFASETTPIGGTDFKPIAADIDGDGDTDIVWYRPTTGLANVWLATSSGTFTKVNNVNVGTDATLYAGDFNNNHRAELLVYRPGITSSFREWNGSAFVTYRSFSSSGWTPIVGNFDGASGDDILWYSEGGGNVAAWWSTGSTTMTSSFLNPIAAGYRPFAGDFDGDGKSDVFLYMPGSSAPDRVWYGKADRTFDSRAMSVSGDYRPLVGDFDADGKADVIWENPSSIVDRVWRGSTRGSFVDNDRISLDGDFVGLVGRFDGNSASDVFWYKQ